jgi:hypothetical protein
VAIRVAIFSDANTAVDRDGRDVSARSLAQRRIRLESVVAGSELVFPVRRLAPDGLAAWQQVVERGYEGYVAKDEASAYEGGRDTAVAEDQAEGLDHWRRQVDPTNQRERRVESRSCASKAGDL